MMFRMFKQEMEALISRHETYRYGQRSVCQFESHFLDFQGFGTLPKIESNLFLSFQAHFEHGDKEKTSGARTPATTSTKISAAMHRINLYFSSTSLSELAMQCYIQDYVDHYGRRME